MTNPIELADELFQEANGLLADADIWSPFLASGKVILTGSTYLDLLVFPDLDVYFQVTPGQDPLDVFSKAASHWIPQHKVRSIEFDKDMHTRYPNMVPVGTILQARVQHGKRLWKLDIWAVKDPAFVQEKLDELNAFKTSMTTEQRALILKAKHKLMAPFGRTPVGSSYLVYLAVLTENLKSVDEVFAYIRSKDGNIDRLK